MVKRILLQEQTNASVKSVAYDIMMLLYINRKYFAYANKLHPYRILSTPAQGAWKYHPKYRIFFAGKFRPFCKICGQNNNGYFWVEKFYCNDVNLMILKDLLEELRYAYIEGRKVYKQDTAINDSYKASLLNL